MAEVGELAGYSRGLPVHYFGSKEKLLGAVAESLVQAYYSSFARQPEAERGLPRLKQMIRQYVAAAPTPGLRALGILIAHAAVVPILSEKIMELAERGQRTLEEELIAGQKAGNVRQGVDYKLVAGMIYSFLRGQLGFAVLNQDFDGKSVAEVFIDALDLYLGTPEGVKLPRAAVAVRSTRSNGRGKNMIRTTT